jgi:hypothetical protein
MKNMFFLNIIFLLGFSCTQLTPEEEMIKKALGKTVEIGMFESVRQGDREIPFEKFRDEFKFISLVYLEDGCSPCYPRFIEWQTRMDTLNLNDDFSVLFIIRGRSHESFINNLLQSNPEYELSQNRFHIVMDPDYRLLDNNPGIDRWVIDRSLLIDPENEIKLIGPPFASARMTELFYTICNKKI